MYRKVVTIGVISLLTGAVFAEEASKSTQGKWVGQAELGVIRISGNTTTETVKAKTGISTERENWRHKAEASMLFSENEDSITAEKYTLGAKTDYKFTEHNYAFASADYENERNSGYHYRVTEVLGYGYRALHMPTMTLDLEIGPGARQSELDDGDTESEFVVRGVVKYGWEISETAKFNQTFKVDYGAGEALSTSLSELSAQINSSLAMKLAVLAKHNTAPVGEEATDTETTVTLVYGF